MMDEQAVLIALRTLPIAVCITPHSTGYVWQCLSGSGSSPTLAEAMTRSLTYMTQQLAGDETVIEDLLHSR